MAESYVFDIADSLLENFASYAYKEASRACGVYEDLQRMKETLSIVKCFLLDAENKKHPNHGLCEWLRQIQNICFNAEDVFDEVECQNSSNQLVHSSGTKRMKVGHFFSSPFFPS